MKVSCCSWKKVLCAVFCLIFFSGRISPSFSRSHDHIVRAQSIIDRFTAIKTMTGDFVQWNPNGKRAEGIFYLERPGKIRFSYKGIPLQVIADGQFVGVNNRALNTWNFYEIVRTPLRFLLNDKIDLSSGNLLQFRDESGITTIVLYDKSLGKGQIRMFFDSKSYMLRQWTIIDQQNLATTVQVMNVRTGVRFVDGMFTIPRNKAVVSRNARN